MALQEREAVRTQHNLSLITRADEGLGWRRIANGVYGFTYTPASADGGLFAKQSLLAYEMHKRPDGSLWILAYGTAEEAEKLTRSGSPELHVYPEPVEASTTLLQIPHARVGTSKELDRDNKNKLRVTLKAV